MPLCEAAHIGVRTKAENFRNVPTSMLQASFVPILKPLPHLAQFLHVSAILLVPILPNLQTKGHEN